jgi:hypothetical protein
MAAIAVGRAVGLTDAAGRDIGSLLVEERETDRLLGTFTPGADYPAVESLFRYFEELVEQQCLSLVDEADAAIQAIGPRLADGTPVHDVQIYSDGGASFRLPAAADRNGRPVS